MEAPVGVPDAPRCSPVALGSGPRDLGQSGHLRTIEGSDASNYGACRRRWSRS